MRSVRGELAEGLEQLGDGRLVADPPSASAAARRFWSEGPCRSSISRERRLRSRRRLAEWIAAWRTVSSGSASAADDDQPTPQVVDPCRRPRRRSAAPRANWPVHAAHGSSAAESGSVTASSQCLDGPVADRRAWIAKQA